MNCQARGDRSCFGLVLQPFSSEVGEEIMGSGTHYFELSGIGIPESSITSITASIREKKGGKL